ncbi:hypothetical protein [Okeania sp. SIO2C9]|uniref:hypothetical protein n=1 Tax=Okeania sp. SIO2C9 TaxID=2607791 RepID=UPI00345DA810
MSPGVKTAWILSGCAYTGAIATQRTAYDIFELDYPTYIAVGASRLPYRPWLD